MFRKNLITWCSKYEKYLMPVAGCGCVFVANITDVHSIWGVAETFNGVVRFIANPWGLQSALPYECDWQFLTPSLYSLELILSYFLPSLHVSHLSQKSDRIRWKPVWITCHNVPYGVLSLLLWTCDLYFASGQNETGVTHRTQYVPMHMAKCME